MHDGRVVRTRATDVWLWYRSLMVSISHRVSSRGTARCWALSLGMVVADGGIGSVSEREAVRASGGTKRVMVARLGLDSNVTVASARCKGLWSA